MIDLNPTNSEPKRVEYEKAHCAGVSPTVRFSHYNVQGYPQGNEMVIPESLQAGVTVKCFDLPRPGLSDDSEDETPPSNIPKLGLKDNTIAKEWRIAGDVPPS